MNLDDKLAKAIQGKAVEQLNRQLDELNRLLFLSLNDPQDQKHPGLDHIQELFQQWIIVTAKLLSKYIHPQRGKHYLDRMEDITRSTSHLPADLVEQLWTAYDFVQSLVVAIQRNPQNVLNY